MSKYTVNQAREDIQALQAQLAEAKQDRINLAADLLEAHERITDLQKQLEARPSAPQQQRATAQGDPLKTQSVALYYALKKAGKMADPRTAVRRINGTRCVAYHPGDGNWRPVPSKWLDALTARQAS